ncbi:hypothetical protein [Grimontia hollisae]|uniref:hypothetical protein n=1 Tax=Grimontia hollisae TaxID=673 RepID=UPI00165E4BFF|nr:hypothetical protein [Grimontia hollisae]
MFYVVKTDDQRIKNNDQPPPQRTRASTGTNAENRPLKNFKTDKVRTETEAGGAGRKGSHVKTDLRMKKAKLIQFESNGDIK